MAASGFVSSNEDIAASGFVYIYINQLLFLNVSPRFGWPTLILFVKMKPGTNQVHKFCNDLLQMLIVYTTVRGQLASAGMISYTACGYDILYRPMQCKSSHAKTFRLIQILIYESP